MNNFMKCILVLFVALNSSYAAVIEISLDEASEKALEEIITYESSILDYFWAGNDGVECGEPKIENLRIDYKKEKIQFTVMPMALSYSCEERAMNCEVKFKRTLGNSATITDEPVFLYEQCTL